MAFAKLSSCFKVGIDSIRQGIQYGTATQAPALEGGFVVPVVLKFLRGEDVPQDSVYTESRITSDNLAKFADACSAA